MKKEKCKLSYVIQCKDSDKSITIPIGDSNTELEKNIYDINFFVELLAKTINADNNAGKNKSNIQEQLENLIFIASQNKERTNKTIYGQMQKNPGLDTIHAIANNLRSLGVEVVFQSQSRLAETLGYPNAKAGVKDGVIYLSEKSIDITAPAHELLHIIFSVFKLTNFSGYQKFLDAMDTSPEFAKFKQECLDNEIFQRDYKNMMGLDVSEEIFIRYFEKKLSKDYVYHGNTVEGNVPVYDLISDTLGPIIQQTFGLKEQPNVFKFLEALIKDIPTFGTKIFFPQRMESTGYLAKKHFVKQNARIIDWIRHLIENKELKEVECK